MTILDFYKCVKNPSIKKSQIKWYLLLSNHNLETVKVGQVTTNLELGKLLGSTSGSPLVGNTGGSPALADGGSASPTGKLNGELGQVDAADADDLALNLGGRPINNNLITKGRLATFHLTFKICVRGYDR